MLVGTAEDSGRRTHQPPSLVALLRTLPLSSCPACAQWWTRAATAHTWQASPPLITQRTHLSMASRQVRCFFVCQPNHLGRLSLNSIAPGAPASFLVLLWQLTPACLSCHSSPPVANHDPSCLPACLPPRPCPNQSPPFRRRPDCFLQDWRHTTGQHGNDGRTDTCHGHVSVFWCVWWGRLLLLLRPPAVLLGWPLRRACCATWPAAAPLLPLLRTAVCWRTSAT